MLEDPLICTKKYTYSKKLKLKKINLGIIKRLDGRNIIQAKNIFKFAKVFEAQIGLFIIVGFSLVMNLSIASAKNMEQTVSNNPLVAMSPEAITETVVTINKYLPEITIDKDKIQLAMAMQSDSNYLSVADEFSTNITPADPVVIPKIAAPANRGKSITYSVQQGDTLSGISAQFGLSVSTLKYSNDLSNQDSLKLGQSLKIPTANLSSNALVKLQNKSTGKTLAYSGRNTTARDGSGVSDGSYIVPVSSHGISRGLSSFHHGIDYMCSVGSSVKASSDGTIIEAKSFGWNFGWGKTVLISHGNGITTRYAHLSQVNVSVGDHVAQGEIVGKSGNTGNSTGPHLHFQKDKNGKPVYPF